jgi:RNA polymerase sigma factor (sigma-70 family)
MAGARTNPILRLVRTIAGPPGPSDDPDRQLLERFVTEADEGAFRDLVRRHGALVLGVCTRVLDSEHDAEDAFQATFLVLVRKAGSIRAPELLGPWLYGVAQRTALKVKAAALRRRRLEKRLAELGPPARSLPGPGSADHLTWRDLRAVIDEEVSRLPRKYRAAVVLCYLEGKTNEQAARILGCPPGTVYSRLAWARERLRSQLSRRGVALTVAALATFLTSSAASASVPARLASVTSEAATGFAAGKAAAAGTTSAQAAAFAEGVLREMFLTKLKTAAVALLAGVAGTAAVLLTCQALAGGPARVKNEGAARSIAKEADKPKTDKDSLQGAWIPVSAEEDGKKIPEDVIKARNFEMVFTEDKVTLPIKGDSQEAGYKLDPTKKPKQIDLLLGEGKTAKGIYLLEGDTLTLCVEKEPGGERPAEFAAKEGTTRVLMVLKKKK